MTLTVAQLLKIDPVLAKLVKTPMGARAAFRVGHTAKILAPHLSAAADARLKLYQRYGNQDDSGTITIPSSHMDEFTQEMSGLCEEKITVNVKPIRLDDLADVQALTGEDMITLAPILVE